MRDTRFLQSIQKVTEGPNAEFAGNNKVMDSEGSPDIQKALTKKRQTMFMNIPRIQAVPLAGNEIEIESKPVPNPSPIAIKQKTIKLNNN